jgi:hypothetical protein
MYRVSCFYCLCMTLLSSFRTFRLKALPNIRSRTCSIIKSSCRENGRVFIENSNIKDSHLNSRGLHLNPSGSLLLQKHFKLLLKN